MSRNSIIILATVATLSLADVAPGAAAAPFGHVTAVSSSVRLPPAPSRPSLPFTRGGAVGNGGFGGGFNGGLGGIGNGGFGNGGFGGGFNRRNNITNLAKGLCRLCK